MSRDADDSLEDALINFLFGALPVRGVLLQCARQWQSLHGLHAYPPVARDLLGEAIAASTMIASTMKFEGMLTLQLKGAGALGMLIAQCDNTLKMRGMSGELETGTEAASYRDLIGDGQLSVTVDARAAKDRYRGIVGVHEGALAETLATYYRDSAQLQAHFVLRADATQLTALMLQRMPDASDLAADDWHRLCLMADTLTPEELAGGVSTAMLGKLFAEDDLRVFEARPIEFSCRCSDVRAENAVLTLGEADANALLDERDGEIDIVCEFCNRRRVLDRVDIARLFNPAGVRSDAGVH